MIALNIFKDYLKGKQDILRENIEIYQKKRKETGCPLFVENGSALIAIPKFPPIV